MVHLLLFSPTPTGMPDDLNRFLDQVRGAVDARLPELVAGLEPPASGEELLPSAVRGALVSPGKRVRPALVFLAGELFGAPRDRLLDPACAVEMVHAASLALDDLPCMDDATTRRGRPALHVVHGVDLAILASVALLTRAFGVLADAGLSARGLPATTALDLVARLAESCGLSGLASGQALDLRSEGLTDFDALEAIHARKTGALFVAAAEFGAVLGAAREKELAFVRSYARNVGLAFQIVDDLLEDSPPEEIGKDARRPEQPSFVRRLGAEAARRIVAELTAHASEALDPFGARAALLRDFAAHLRDRSR